MLSSMLGGQNRDPALGLSHGLPVRRQPFRPTGLDWFMNPPETQACVQHQDPVSRGVPCPLEHLSDVRTGA